MSALWSAYNKLLTSHPVLTKACTSFTGFTAGDALAQKFVEPADAPYDYKRTAKLATFGFLFHGPAGHHFYRFLDSKLAGTAPKTVVTKVFIDQTMWNPVFSLCYFGYLNVAEGKSMSDYERKCKADLKTAVVGSWTVWVPAHLVNFAFVPPQQRLLYINSIQIGYNVFLSFLGNKAVESTPKK